MGQHTTDRLAPVVSLAERRAARERVPAGDVPEGAVVWVQADRRWRAMVRVGGGL